MDLRLGVPVIGLGASAPSYYGALGDRLGTRMVLPEHAGVANAIGAVVGQVSVHAEGSVTSGGAGVFRVHTGDGPAQFADRDTALKEAEAALTSEAEARARLAGIGAMTAHTDIDLREVDVEGQPMFIEATLRVTVQGRPRIASG